MSLARCFCVATWLAAAVPAYTSAQTTDPWIVKVGVHDVDPKSDNGNLAGGALAVEVGSSVRPTLSLEYLLTPNIGLEVLAALPFEHDVKLNGTTGANVKQLPPTVSLQYHFAPASSFSPFVGVGVNYTRFFDIDERGPLTGTQLNLSSSWGFAAHAGVDMRFGDRWLVGADLRWINIDSDARVNGARVGTVNIDPLVYGVYGGYRF
jgi:outer membrane protein